MIFFCHRCYRRHHEISDHWKLLDVKTHHLGSTNCWNECGYLFIFSIFFSCAQSLDESISKKREGTQIFPRPNRWDLGYKKDAFVSVSLCLRREASVAENSCMDPICVLSHIKQILSHINAYDGFSFRFFIFARFTYCCLMCLSTSVQSPAQYPASLQCIHIVRITDDTLRNI